MKVKRGMVAKFDKLAGINKKMKKLQIEADALKLEIKAAVNNEPGDITHGIKVLGKIILSHTLRLDGKRLKAEQPDIYQQYSKDTTTLSLKLTT